MTPPPPQLNIWHTPTGTVIRACVGWYDHVALVGDRFLNGERSVLGFSPEAGGFIEQPYSEFAQRRRVTIEGYLGSLPAEVVLQRARQIRARYSWTDFNCEHFVRFAHGVTVESPQLQRWTLLAGLVAFATYAIARA